MYNQELHLHFIGIGGVGMAGIAEVLIEQGYSVSGSDVKRNALVEHLAARGADVRIGHKAENIPAATNVVVISSAIRPDNEELLAARERLIPVIPRAAMLAELMRMKYGIAIAGSHGKTTTTTMTAKVLQSAGFEPTVIIGGRERNKVSGAFMGSGQYLVAEADESDGSFCLLRPAIAVVTNIDREHLGHYGSFSELERAFGRFMAAVPFYGLIVACFDDPVVARLAREAERRMVSFGLSPVNDIQAVDIEVGSGMSVFTLRLKGHEVKGVRLPMPGVHMVSNALASIAVGLELGAYLDECIDGLAQFEGVARRSEMLASCREVIVIDDYAHHPTEIAATLAGIRQSCAAHLARGDGRAERGRLIALFQPHRFSRTQDLFAEFLGCFNGADRVVVTEIYSAGEEPVAGVSGHSLAKSIQHDDVSFVPDIDAALPEFIRDLRPGDVVVTLGAGSIGQTGAKLAAALKTV